MIYFSLWEPYVPAHNIMWVGGGAAIGFGLWNITHGNTKGGVVQVILGSLVVLGSFWVK